MGNGAGGAAPRSKRARGPGADPQRGTTALNVLILAAAPCTLILYPHLVTLWWTASKARQNCATVPDTPKHTHPFILLLNDGCSYSRARTHAHKVGITK